VLTDVVNRWNNLKGIESQMLTGMDEHGIKIQQAAERSKMTPQQKVDIEAQKFKSLFDNADIKYDRFIRTTDSDHKNAVCDIWNRFTSLIL
jgi:methionyl-tRNA synthetase